MDKIISFSVDARPRVYWKHCVVYVGRMGNTRTYYPTKSSAIRAARAVVVCLQRMADKAAA